MTHKNRDSWIGQLIFNFSSLDICTPKPFGFHEHRKRNGGLKINWGPSPVTVKRERTEKCLEWLSPGRTLPRVYQGGKDGLKGWPCPFAGVVFIHSLVGDGFQYASGLGTSWPEKPGETVSAHCCSFGLTQHPEDMVCSTYKPHCNRLRDSHLEITPHHWTSILRHSFHQEVSMKATAVEWIIISPLISHACLTELWWVQFSLL